MSRFLIPACAGLLVIAAAVFLSPDREADLKFSDPANVGAPPRGAIGFPSRAPDFDVRPGFQSPPPGYGEVAFFWWLGDPLTKERLIWQLDQLAGRGITGLQINYAHSDSGGVSYGLTLPSDPPLFSPAWWELVRWFAAEARQRGMSISLSDYTLGLGQGRAMDAAIVENPDLIGAQLEAEWKTLNAGGECDWTLPGSMVSLMAYQWKGDAAVPGTGLDLRPHAADGRLRWASPAGGPWRVVGVFARRVVPSFDPTHPQAGPAYIKHFFQPFEDHLPGQAGQALNFFFSDELEFRLPGKIWGPRLAAEFRARKGYDFGPEAAALFLDIGPRTPKIRLDYNDVRVALSEENFFKPVFDWHQSRGMIFGCDHGGRGQDVVEFGDYFRTQRWNQGPGCDQPNLEKNLIKAKVASSIAHLYERPRVWLEGYHSSGWGTTSAGVIDATFADFLMGHNLLSFHGLYYSTHGGFWEWAPPDNHWRMPYWLHMGGFMRAVERLSFLLSQGRHVCDVAVMYPVAPAEAGMDGSQAVEAAFAAGRALYGAGLDFDFIDFESVLRANVDGGSLCVSGEKYRVLVLPAMKAIRFEALQKAAAFVAAGGTVIAVGALPEASERAGRDDPTLDRLVRDTFGLTAGQAAGLKEFHLRHGETGGVAAFVPKGEGLVRVLDKVLDRDIDFERKNDTPIYFQHRRIGPRDIYGIYGLPQGAAVHFRATGMVELWDPWTGKTKPLAVRSQDASGTRLHLPLEATEIQLIVFSPGRAEIETAPAVRKPTVMEVEGPWIVELKPTLDNRWGDFRWPPAPVFLGAEARRFRYVLETSPDPGWQDPAFDDSSWVWQTCSFGPRFWRLGPLPDGVDAAEIEARLAASDSIDPRRPVRLGDRDWPWTPYEFSWRWGVEEDPGHQGYHGLKEEMSDEFIRLGNPRREATTIVRESESSGSRYFLWTTIVAPVKTKARILMGGMIPAAVRLNGRLIGDGDREMELKAGANPLFLRYDHPGTGWVLAVRPDFGIPATVPGSLAMRWNGAPGIFPFEIHPEIPTVAGWYRFKAAPGLRAMTVTSRGPVQAWTDGRPLSAKTNERNADGTRRQRFVLPEPIHGQALVALRVLHELGAYGGAALPEPIEFECGEGDLEAGDWSRVEGLAAYSGGILYKKTVVRPERMNHKSVILDLGEVAASAEVFVNGRSAGIRLAPPWRWDITASAKPGPNRIEVLIYNTLSNHYQTIPTRYRGHGVSGLLGPVRLIME
jgi:hypothetical protein